MISSMAVFFTLFVFPALELYSCYGALYIHKRSVWAQKRGLVKTLQIRVPRISALQRKQSAMHGIIFGRRN